MRPDMVPGALFPDYELSDHTGKHRKLPEMQGQHPMVLVLSRGGYCPKDRRRLAAKAARLCRKFDGELARRDSVVSISPRQRTSPPRPSSTATALPQSCGCQRGRQIATVSSLALSYSATTDAPVGACRSVWSVLCKDH